MASIPAPGPRRSERRRRHRNEQRRIVGVGLAAFLALSTIAGVDVARAHTQVSLTVDGISRPVTAWDNRVGSLVRAGGVELGDGDEIQPALDQRVESGDEIVVRRARPVTLRVAGRSEEIHTTAQTLLSVLAESGRDGLRIPASRSSVRQDIAMLAERGTPVTVRADGEDHETKVIDRFSVDELLTQTGVEASPIDRVDLAEDGAGRLVVEVTRVERGSVTEEREIAFKSVEKESDELAKGERRVETEGKKGREELTRYRQSVGGEEIVSTTVSAKVISEPVDEVVLVGTADPKELAERKAREEREKARASAPPAGNYSGADPRGIAQDLVAARGWGQGEFNCLVTLWNRESGWNPYASNASSGAYGIPQALPGSKMASAGADWKTNPATQIKWGLGYISGRYGTPCGALGHSNSAGWY